MGGFYCNNFLTQTTHVIADKINTNDKESFKIHKAVHVVNHHYLFHCLMYRKKIDEVEYPPIIEKPKILPVDTGFKYS